MKHEKPPSPPPAAFPLTPLCPCPPTSPLSYLLLFPTPSEKSRRVPLSVPAVPTSNFECITGPPLTLSIPSSLRSDGDITITGT